MRQHNSFEEVEGRIADVDGLIRDGQEKFLFDTVKKLPRWAAMYCEKILQSHQDGK